MARRLKSNNNDLDKFYSDVPLDTWAKILSPKMHYHFGEDNTNNVDIFDMAVRSLYRYLQEGSTVLDCGCGWGGPARMLIDELGCKVEGVTISRQQSQFIRDFKVYHQDLSFFSPGKFYDTAIFIESFTHLNDPYIVLKNISPHVNQILIKDFCCNGASHTPAWSMNIYSSKDYIRLLEATGFKVVEIVEGANHMRSSFEYWHKNISLFISKSELIGQVRLLHELCQWGMRTDHLRETQSPSSIRGILLYASLFVNVAFAKSKSTDNRIILFAAISVCSKRSRMSRLDKLLIINSL